MNRSKLVGQIPIPTYTADQDIIRAKIKAGIELSQSDINILKLDAKDKTINEITAKYPGLNVKFLLN